MLFKTVSSRKHNSLSSLGQMRWYNSNNEECVLQLACNWPVNVCRHQSFNRGGLLSYCSRPTGGAGDSFSTYPGLTSTIFCRTYCEKRKNLSFISRNTTSFRSADVLLVDQSLQFNWNTARFRVFDVATRLPAIRRDNAGSVCFWGIVKHVCVCPFIKIIFGFLFRKCLLFSHVCSGHQDFTSYLYLLDATV